jgi:hypothetical protein
VEASREESFEGLVAQRGRVHSWRSVPSPSLQWCAMTDCVFCVGEQTVAHSYLHVVIRHTGDDIKPE